MAEKDKKDPILGESGQNIPKIPQVRGEAFGLRGIRGTLSGAYDEAMERVWRNCLYPDVITFDQYYRMYARNNVAARVIETFPDYSWSVSPFATDKNGPNSRFSKAATALLETMYPLQDGIRQSLLTSMKQLDVLGGIGGESLLVFGFADGRKLEEPVSKRAGMRIDWIKILHNGQFEIEKRDDIEISPTYGDVLLYRSKAFSTNVELNFHSQVVAGKSIHSSRCVHFKESSGLTYGTSRIQKCYNQLIDLTKLAGASAEVYWLGAFSGLAIETDPEAQLSDEAYKKITEDTKKYFDGLARAMVFEGASAKLLYPAIVSPKDHFDLQITMISIATGIPRRFLTGAEAAKLASQQDTLNWDERVINRREMFVGPKVVSPVVQRCIDAGVIPMPKDGDFTVTWPRIQSIALNERADASRNMTAAWQMYLSSGMTEVIPFREFLLYTCGFSESEAENIASKCDTTKWKLVQKASAGGAAAPASGTSKAASGASGASNSSDFIELELRLSDLEGKLSGLSDVSQQLLFKDREEPRQKKRS